MADASTVHEETPEVKKRRVGCAHVSKLASSPEVQGRREERCLLMVQQRQARTPLFVLLWQP
jgi:hypothetical protein